MNCKDLSFITPETEKTYLNLNHAIHNKEITVLQGDNSRINTLS